MDLVGILVERRGWVEAMEPAPLTVRRKVREK
jgi:hypothetical protein